MPLFVLLCALIGAWFLLPLLPALLFLLLMVYGLLRLCEDWLNSPKKRKKRPPSDFREHP